MIERNLNLFNEPDNPFRPLVLKVVNRTTSSVEQIEIHESRCIIGSSENASVCINSANLQPCHCEIVRNPSGIYVREIAEGVMVNGQPMSEAWVFAGDQLTVGDLCFEIIEAGKAPFKSTLQYPPAEIQQDETADQQVEPADQPFEAVADQPVENQAPDFVIPALSITPEDPITPEDREQHHRENTRQISDPIQRTGNVEGTVNPDEKAAGTATPRPWDQPEENADPAGWLNELYDSAVPDNPDEDGAARQQREFTQNMVGWEVSPLTHQVMQPNVDPSTLGELPQPTQEEASRILNQIDQLQETISPPEEVAPTTPPQQPVQANTDLQSRPDPQPEPDQAIDPPTSNTPESGIDLSGLLESLAMDSPATPVVEEPAPAAQAPAEPVIDPMPVAESTPLAAEPPQVETVADVLARMKKAGQIDSSIPDVEPVVPPREIPQPVSSAMEPSVEAAGESNSSQNEDSVQDYMNQLMQRLRQDDHPPEVETQPTEEPDQSPEDTSQVKSATVNTGTTDDLTPANPLMESEFLPGQQAPEKSSTLEALRQVANQSVRNAIRKSAREKNFHSSMIYLGGSGACLFLSAVLFMLSGGFFDAAFILGGLFAVGCAGMGFMYLSISQARERLEEMRQTMKENRQDRVQRKSKQR